jgi:hypothetical protein
MAQAKKGWMFFSTLSTGFAEALYEGDADQRRQGRHPLAMAGNTCRYG